MADRMMKGKTVIFLHGFASSGQSTKAQYFRDKFDALPQVDYRAIDFNPTLRDFEHVTTTGQIARLRQYVLDRELSEFSIIGSSYGGLVAIHYAKCFGGVERMLLLAPGLRWLSGGLSDDQLETWKQAGSILVAHSAFKQDVPVRHALHVDGLRYLEPVAPAVPVMIIHGSNDETVPIDDSRAYARQYRDKVQLIELEADHDLNDHLDLIWGSVQSFLLHDRPRR